MHDCPLCDSYIHDQLEYPTEPEHIEYRDRLIRIISDVKSPIKEIIKECDDVIDIFRGFACKDIYSVCESYPVSSMLMVDCISMICTKTGMRFRAARRWFIHRLTSILATIYEIHQEHTSGIEYRTGKVWLTMLPFALAVPAEDIQMPLYDNSTIRDQNTSGIL